MRAVLDLSQTVPGARAVAWDEVLPVRLTRNDRFQEEEGHVAPPLWLGAFPMSRTHRCATRCGALAIARAAWIYRGELLVVLLCLDCCRRARDHVHPCLSIPPQLLPTEQRPTRPTDPTRPRISGWRRATR